MISINAILKTRRGGEPVTWTGRALPFDGEGVCYGNGNWVIAGASTIPQPGGHLATAADPAGVWTTQYYHDPQSSYFQGVYYGSDGNWVTVGNGNGGRIFSAVDPTGAWTQETAAPPLPTLHTRVHYNGTHWVCGAQPNYTSGAVFVTTDPSLAWVGNQVAALGSISIIYDIFYANGYWVAVGAIPAGAPQFSIYTATDPTGVWTHRVIAPPVPTSTILYGVSYGNGYWVAVGEDGYLLTATDPTGVWTQRASGFGASYIYGVSYGAGSWVAVGSDGKLATAVDPTGAWTQRVSGFGASVIYDVYYGADGYWVAVGFDAKMSYARPGV